MASTIFGRQWPALTHQRPAVPSSILAAVGRLVMHALAARASRRGACLELPVGGEGHPEASVAAVARP
jgi:hypothetical protein